MGGHEDPFPPPRVGDRRGQRCARPPGQGGVERRRRHWTWGTGRGFFATNVRVWADGVACAPPAAAACFCRCPGAFCAPRAEAGSADPGRYSRRARGPRRGSYDFALARWRRCFAASFALRRAARSRVRGCLSCVRFIGGLRPQSSGSREGANKPLVPHRCTPAVPHPRIY